MKTSLHMRVIGLGLAVINLSAAVEQTTDLNYVANGYGTATIFRYQGPGGAVTFPNEIDALPVTIVGSPQNSSGTSATIPEGASGLGYQASWGCTNLTSATVPESTSVAVSYEDQ